MAIKSFNLIKKGVNDLCSTTEVRYLTKSFRKIFQDHIIYLISLTCLKYNFDYTMHGSLVTWSVFHVLYDTYCPVSIEYQQSLMKYIQFSLDLSYIYICVILYIIILFLILQPTLMFASYKN